MEVKTMPHRIYGKTLQEISTQSKVELPRHLKQERNRIVNPGWTMAYDIGISQFVSEAIEVIRNEERSSVEQSLEYFECSRNPLSTVFAQVAMTSSPGQALELLTEFIIELTAITEGNTCSESVIELHEITKKINASYIRQLLSRNLPKN